MDNVDYSFSQNKDGILELKNPLLPNILKSILNHAQGLCISYKFYNLYYGRDMHLETGF